MAYSTQYNEKDKTNFTNLLLGLGFHNGMSFSAKKVVEKKKNLIVLTVSFNKSFATLISNLKILNSENECNLLYAYLDEFLNKEGNERYKRYRKLSSNSKSFITCFLRNYTNERSLSETEINNIKESLNLLQDNFDDIKSVLKYFVKTLSEEAKIKVEQGNDDEDDHYNIDINNNNKNLLGIKTFVTQYKSIISKIPMKGKKTLPGTDSRMKGKKILSGTDSRHFFVDIMIESLSHNIDILEGKLLYDNFYRRCIDLKYSYKKRMGDCFTLSSITGFEELLSYIICEGSEDKKLLANVFKSKVDNNEFSIDLFYNMIAGFIFDANTGKNRIYDFLGNDNRFEFIIKFANIFIEICNELSDVKLSNVCFDKKYDIFNVFQEKKSLQEQFSRLKESFKNIVISYLTKDHIRCILYPTIQLEKRESNNNKIKISSLSNEYEFQLLENQLVMISSLYYYRLYGELKGILGEGEEYDKDSVACKLKKLISLELAVGDLLSLWNLAHKDVKNVERDEITSMKINQRKSIANPDKLSIYLAISMRDGQVRDCPLKNSKNFVHIENALKFGKIEINKEDYKIIDNLTYLLFIINKYIPKTKDCSIESLLIFLLCREPSVLNDFIIQTKSKFAETYTDDNRVKALSDLVFDLFQENDRTTADESQQRVDNLSSVDYISARPRYEFQELKDSELYIDGMSQKSYYDASISQTDSLPAAGTHRQQEGYGFSFPQKTILPNRDVVAGKHLEKKQRSSSVHGKKTFVQVPPNLRRGQSCHGTQGFYPSYHTTHENNFSYPSQVFGHLEQGRTGSSCDVSRQGYIDSNWVGGSLSQPSHNKVSRHPEQGRIKSQPSHMLPPQGDFHPHGVHYSLSRPSHSLPLGQAHKHFEQGRTNSSRDVAQQGYIDQKRIGNSLSQPSHTIPHSQVSRQQKKESHFVSVNKEGYDSLPRIKCNSLSQPYDDMLQYRCREIINIGSSRDVRYGSVVAPPRTTSTQNIDLLGPISSMPESCVQGYSQSQVQVCPRYWNWSNTCGDDQSFRLSQPSSLSRYSEQHNASLSSIAEQSYAPHNDIPPHSCIRENSNGKLRCDYHFKQYSAMDNHYGSQSNV